MLISDQETTCSSHKNDSLSTVMRNDVVRYRRKGYGLVFALAITITFFYYGPQLLQMIWLEYIGLATGTLFFNLEKNLYVFTILFINIAVLLVSNLLMLFIYKSKVPFFENYRISNKPWPWEQNPEKWNKILKSTLKSILFNILFIQTTVLYLDTTSHFQIKFSLEQMPNKFTHLWQILLFMLAEDFFFFIAHSTLHRPGLYWIHKKHHQYNITISIAAQYSHPLEFLLANAIPTGIGFRILSLISNVHMSTIILWIIIRVMQTTDGHCGYQWSWSVFRLLPMSGSAQYHNFHHSNNVGNFSSFFTIWDTIFGTNKYYFEYKGKKQREEYLNSLRKEYEIQKKKDRQVIKEVIDE